jgi:REP element-mobilizing transposase RayT
MPFYQRHLPHWHPEGAALFVTWRLHGSLPRILATFEATDRELAQGAFGPHWLEDRRIASLVVHPLRFAQDPLSLYELRAWVVMPNHVHILICPRAELKRITRAVKTFTAREANSILGRTGQPFWQDESYDHWVRSRQEMEATVRYIESNPVAAGLAGAVEEWPWSSAAAGERPGDRPEACPT